MIGETTTLRDAARRLARAKNPKAKGIQSTALFNLLRAGKLRAGFYMLEGSAWVEIPINYWEGLALKRFGKIARTRTIRNPEAPDCEAINFQIKLQRSLATEFKPVPAIPAPLWPRFRQ